MRTRRSVLVGVGGLIALAGCSQQSGQPAEEQGSDSSTGEFTVEQFRVGGENPDEYEAEFIAGSDAAEVADELTPEVSYRISGASEEVETQVRYEYSDATIPEDEPLDETVEADTHDGNGEYAQVPSMPDSLVSEILQNPKNLAVRFRATDMESEVAETEEYELNFADSYIEQIQTEAFNDNQMVISEAELENLNVENGVIDIEFNSNYEIGSQEFNNQLGNFSGLYSGNVELTRIPYEVDLTVNDNNGEAYQKQIEGERAKSFLNGEITEREFSDNLYINQLWTE